MSAAIIAQVTAPGEHPHNPGARGPALDVTGEAGEVAAWAAAGAMWLTGPPGSAPLGPPAGLVPKLRAIGALAAAGAASLGGSPAAAADPIALLGQRAALSGLRRRGATSCGGATRLLPVRDGWVAVSLARGSDVELIPAWLEIEPPDLGRVPRPSGTPAAEPLWDTVAAHVAAAPAGAAALVERARMLGLPAAALPREPAHATGVRDSHGPHRPPAPPSRPATPGPLPLRAIPLAGAPGPPAPAPADIHDIVVADLGSLWAGPLAGALLAAAGARVVKVESTDRPDGARGGPAAFFDLLNAGKRSVALDLRSPGGARRLAQLLARADVVIEASRPRALAQLGIDAEALVARGRPRVWVSLTGYGRRPPQGDWAAFGDDAAVAGGLVSWHDGEPYFCADAIADPASGLVAAAGVVDALGRGGRWLLDVAMADVAAHLAGPTLPAGHPPPDAPPPEPPSITGRAPALGRHTGEVLAELGITS